MAEITFADIIAEDLAAISDPALRALARQALRSGNFTRKAVRYEGRHWRAHLDAGLLIWYVREESGDILVTRVRVQ